MRYLWLTPLLALAACSSAPQAAKQPEPASNGPGPATPAGRHPLAKFIELGGFRLRETAPGKLQVKLIAVNHSEADLGELTVKVRMTTSVAKPGDPPVVEFDANIPPLGPMEIQDVTTAATSKLRAYELPDWQFLRAEFDITSPAP
jgi:hypothetical protein